MAFQLGSEIINYYNAPGRDGLNANGVEIEFVLVSVEVQSHDSSANNLSQNNGFSATMIDATNNRTENIRAGFSFFRGADSSAPPGSLPFSQRRRIVVLDNTNPADPVILFNDIPLDSGALGAANVDILRAAIDSVEASPPAPTFIDWAGGFPFPPGLGSPGADPDQDGADNLTEFFSGTDPLNGGSIPVNRLEFTPEGILFRFQTSTDRAEIPHQFQTGMLNNFSTYHPDEEDISISEDELGRKLISVLFPPESGPFFRILLTHP